MLKADDIPADDDGSKIIAFRAGPKFFELAERFHLKPGKLAKLVCMRLENCPPESLRLTRDGIESVKG